MTFQRARNDEQREARRRAILETATAMLDEMGVAELTLNELSRRVGRAKSNVLRYFDSREAVLLELLDAAVQEWLTEVSDALVRGVDPRRPVTERADRLSEVLASTLAARRPLCELLGAQGGVLEHNVSVEVVVKHKRVALARLTSAADLLRRHVPELGGEAERVCFHVLVLAGALAPYSSPPAGVQAAYDLEPALAVLHLELRDSLRSAIRMLLTGAVPRA
ncbi:TetR/AcrR family transcriptional regulator [Actinomycetospora atypica]|uniref:TetR/AcrR family transcriptional regulator n=1 Tax=Actinomycetospora atypica TaxID=1290095 RepID=A0ABV9YMU7_9PSEU